MKLILPDLVSSCPFKQSVHPDYERARDESSAWTQRFGAFIGPKAVVFDIYNFELLMALTYPDAGYEELRACCDFNNLMFVYDIYSDQLGGEDVRELGDSLLKALSGDFSVDSVLTDMAKETRLVAKASPNCQKRFLARCMDFVAAVAKEAGLREDNHVLPINSYMTLRRGNCGVQPYFAILEYIHGLDLPEEVFENPVFTRLYWLGVELVALTNDLYSFSVERAKGLDGNNFISVAMGEKGMSMQEATDFLGKEIMLRVNQFSESWKEMPSFGEAVDKEVQIYISGLAKWHIGNVVWSLETPRYFGVERQEVKKTLVVDVKEPGDKFDSDLYENHLQRKRS
ncbi:terpenoid synthase [Schizopora paradoxa]|uniref:Terpene synthase n=1 Tax=Schizopora paradoxa TaxID=27342 RepID=A0A0H2RN72_9AGAM|nr:terpenoid synthase [Schizopora paradoxa]